MMASSALNYVKAITTTSAYPYVAKDQAYKTQRGSSQVMLVTVDALVWLVELKNTLLQLLLILLTGVSTDQASSTTAKPALTTPFCWLVSQVETGRLKTLGEQDGRVRFH